MAAEVASGGSDALEGLALTRPIFKKTAVLVPRDIN
jgi:hypothetical protein